MLQLKINHFCFFPGKQYIGFENIILIPKTNFILTSDKSKSHKIRLEFHVYKDTIYLYLCLFVLD